MIEVDCQISIRKDGKCFLGPVKTELLREIGQNGSLRAAAQKLKISYQHAWTMIEDMNRNAPEPLVIKQRGGAQGGGALLTTYGEKILAEYFVIEQQVKKIVSQINVEINM